ncbi:MAG: 50S ribosomal protein L10 [Candidatus Omnitrophota bacterium]
MGKVGKIFRERLLKNIKEEVSNNHGTFLINYSSLTAAQTDTFRKSMKDLGVKIYVSKNRIAEIALKDLEYGKLAEEIEANKTAFAWTNEDAVSVSKALLKFSKDYEGFQVKGVVLDGVVLIQDDVKRLADLPAKDVLQAKLLGTIIAPLTRLASALNAKSRDLLSILKQLSEKKGGN